MGDATGHQEVTLAGRGRGARLPNPLLFSPLLDILAIKSDGDGRPQLLPVPRGPSALREVLP